MAGYETIVSVERSKQPVATLQHVPCRISYDSEIVVTSDGKKVPVYIYWFHSRVGVPDIRQGDLLTDTVGTKYRVSGLPQPTDMSFLRVMLEKQIAQTP